MKNLDPTTIVLFAQSRCTSASIQWQMTLPLVHLGLIQYLSDPLAYAAVGSSGNVARLDQILQDREVTA
jgi:hypothetical protein